MATQDGIRNTKEVLTALGDMLGAFRRISRDGLQFDDVFQLVQDEDLRASIWAAYEGIRAVTDELSDLSVLETLQLGQHMMSELQHALGTSSREL